MIYASDRHSDNSDTQEHSFVKGKLFAYLYDHVSNLEDGDDITIWLAYKNAYETILLNKNGPSYFCEPFANCNKDVLINEFSSLLADALVFKC